MSEARPPAPSETGRESHRLDREQELAHIREALAGLRYGEVSVVVQDGVVVQIARTEKRRLRLPQSPAKPAQQTS